MAGSKPCTQKFTAASSGVAALTTGHESDHDIPPIDLVVVNLYPFAATVARTDCTLEDAVENIDIGGPTMVRAAAKNHRDVTIVVSASDYDRVIAELETHMTAARPP